jgi:hypothetical protein
LLLKLLAVFFLEVPRDVSVGTPLPIRLFQRLSSLAIRASDYLPILRVFVKSFSFNLRGLSTYASTARLTAQSVTDLYMWRYVLWFAIVHDASLFGTSIDFPIRHLRDPLLSLPEWHRACASRADYVLQVDACKEPGRLGIGAVISHSLASSPQPCAWLSFTVPELQYYWREGSRHEISINLLECFAFVSTLISFITDIFPHHIPLSSTCSSVSSSPSSVLQVHIWSDNTSSLAWMSKRRALSPLHAFLIQIVGHITLQSGIALTSGHLPGVDNDLADAPSRDFQCPSGPTVRALLLSVPRLSPSPHLLAAMLRISTSPSMTTSEVAHLALITAATVTGKISAGSGTFHPF